MLLVQVDTSAVYGLLNSLAREHDLYVSIQLLVSVVFGHRARCGEYGVVHGARVGVVDVIRRLMDRQRMLRHCDRLLAVAVEEALTWLPVPKAVMP